MPWLISFDGVEVSSDDFLLEDLEASEKASGVPWSISNPLREVKVAKAWIAIAMSRAGRSDEEILERLKVLTLKDIGDVFSIVPEAKPDTEGETEDDAHPLAMVKVTKGRTSRGSSPGARGATTGRPRKSAKSA